MDLIEDRPTNSGVLRGEEKLRLRDRSVAASRNGIIITDASQPEAPMIDVNPAVERITGYSAGEILGRNCRMFQGADTDPEARATIRRAMGAREECAITLLNYRRDGTPFWNELHIAPVVDEVGRVTHWVGILDDVSKRKELEAELIHQAFHDPLTGLPNRALIANHLEMALSRAGEKGQSVGVLFVDLDGFKFVNDGLGHEAGDRLLAALAERLQAGLRPGETLARFGGDEFIVLIDSVADPSEATWVAERIAAALRPAILVDGRKVIATASIGIAIGAAPTELAGDLLRHADIAMYRAKRQGKARFELYEAVISVPAPERLGLEEDLRGALGRGELLLHYQPKVELATGRIVGLEALLRWRHPERGIVPPTAFVPIAEEIGLISSLGQWALSRACWQMNEWTKEGVPTNALHWVSVNLSPRQLHDPGLLGDVGRALAESGLAPHYLELEVTEGAVLEDGAAAVEALAGLTELGVELSIDDFGAGFASLAHLRRLPANSLKIDRSLVAGLGGEPETALVAATISLGHALGLRVTAEGVETPVQLARLRDLGCDLGQGYLFASPQPAEAILALLRWPLGGTGTATYLA